MAMIWNVMDSLFSSSTNSSLKKFLKRVAWTARSGWGQSSVMETLAGWRKLKKTRWWYCQTTQIWFLVAHCQMSALATDNVVLLQDDVNVCLAGMASAAMLQFQTWWAGAREVLQMPLNVCHVKSTNTLVIVREHAQLWIPAMAMVGVEVELGHVSAILDGRVNFAM
jgi:hypothetical protein